MEKNEITFLSAREVKDLEKKEKEASIKTIKLILSQSKGKIASAIIAVIYLLFYLVNYGMPDIFYMAVFLVFVLLLIWRSDEFSGYLMSNGFFGILGAFLEGPPKQSVPGIVGKIVGWILLMLPLAMFLIIYLGIGHI